MTGENFTIKKSSIWVIGSVLGAILLVVSIFTGGFNFSGNAVANVGSDGVVEVRTTIQNFKYNPDVITVEKGALVRLIIQNKDNVVHGLHLPQFGISDTQPALGTKIVEFRAVDGPTNNQAVPTCSVEHGETLTFNVI